MSVLGGIIGGGIYTALEALVFLFTLIGTLTAQYRTKTDAKFCYTLWGYKENCSKPAYKSEVTADGRIGSMDLAYGCGERKDRIVAASVLAVLSIFVTVGAIILGVCVILNFVRNSPFPAILSGICLSFLLTAFVLVADVYNQGYCKELRSLRNMQMKLAEGFALLIVAFIFQFCNCVVAFLLWW